MPKVLALPLQFSLNRVLGMLRFFSQPRRQTSMPLSLLLLALALFGCAAEESNTASGSVLTPEDSSSSVKLDIFGLEPNSGDAGAAVAVMGSGLLEEDIDSVSFSDVETVVIAFDPAGTQLEVIVPAQPKGFNNPAPLRVTLKNGSSANFVPGFTYVNNIDCEDSGATPQIAFIKDVNLLADNTLVISGSDFNVNEVVVNLEAIPLELISVTADQIIAKLPAETSSLCSSFPCELTVSVAHGNGCIATAPVNLLKEVAGIEQSYSGLIAGENFGLGLAPMNSSIDSGTDSIPDFAVLSQNLLYMISGNPFDEDSIDPTIWQETLGGPFVHCEPQAINTSLNNVGDIDGDGIEDLAIAQSRDTLDVKAFDMTICLVSGDGTAYARIGDYEASKPADVVIAPGVVLSYGIEVTTIDDVLSGSGESAVEDNDGKADLLISKEFWHADVTGTTEFPIISTTAKQGEAAVFSGSDITLLTASGAAVFKPTPAALIWTDEDAAGYGRKLLNLGDIHGDNERAFIVAAPNAAVGATGGSFYVYSLTEALATPLTDPTPYVKRIDAPPSYDSFAIELTKISDLDGDDVDDVLVLAQQGGLAQNDIIAYSGASLLDDSVASPPLFTLAGFSNIAQISRAGDMNGDGREDFIVGDPKFTGTLGRVYIYSGQVGVGAQPALLGTFDGETPGVQFGFRVSGFSDVNGDGIAEVLASAINDKVWLFNLFGPSILPPPIE